MGASQHKAAVKAYDRKHPYLERHMFHMDDNVPVMKEGWQEAPQEEWNFMIKYYSNAKISIKSCKNNKYLTAESDGTLQFSSQDDTETAKFKVQGFNQGRVCLRNHEGNILAYGTSGVLKILPDTGIQTDEDTETAGDGENEKGYWSWHPDKKKNDKLVHFLLVRDTPKASDSEEEKKQSICEDEDQTDRDFSNRRSKTAQTLITADEIQVTPTGCLDENSASPGLDPRSRKRRSSFTTPHTYDHQSSIPHQSEQRKKAEQPEVNHFWFLHDDEIKDAKIDAVILMLNLFSHEWFEDDVKMFLSKLIDRLSELCPPDDENDEPYGMTEDEFRKAKNTFNPLSNLYLKNPPDNLYKLYSLLIVKRTGLETAKLHRIRGLEKYLLDIPQSQFSDTIADKTKDFESPDEPSVEVDYFCSLVKTVHWGLIHNWLFDMMPFSITNSTAKTRFVKLHAELLFSKLRPFLFFQFLIEISFTVFLTVHIMIGNNHDWLGTDKIVVSLLMLVDFWYLFTSPFTYMFLPALLAPIAKQLRIQKFDKEFTRNSVDFFVTYMWDIWRFAHTLLWIIMFVYLIQYDTEDHHVRGRSWMLCMAVFLAYARIISYFRLIPDFRRLIATIVHVMKRSFLFYVILMTYIFASTFALKALRSEGDFTENFWTAYIMAFGEFEDYETQNELVAFLASSFFGPLLMLNLLIAIMGDAHEEYHDNWEVKSIIEIYEWAQEMVGIIWSATFLFRLCFGDQIFDEIFKKSGYIHHCVADSTGNDTAIEGQWEGQVKQIEKYINNSKDQILDAIEKKQTPNGETDTTNEAPQNPSGVDPHQVDTTTLGMSRRIEALQKETTELRQALEISNAEIFSLHHSNNKAVKDLSEKVDRLLAIRG